MNYELRNSKISAIISTFGAELVGLYDDDGKNYIWSADEKVWKRHAPILFPIIGSLYEGKYKYSGQEYSISKHGFIRDMEGELDYYDNSRISITFKSNQDTLKMYPFKFEFTVVYELSADALVIKYLVKNVDEKAMYFALGFHPGFALPLSEDTKFEDYTVNFESECDFERVLINMSGLIIGGTSVFKEHSISLNREMFQKEAIILKNVPKHLSLSSEKFTTKVEFDFPDMEYLTLWTLPNDDAAYVCLEPWTSLIGKEGTLIDIEDIENIVKLEPNRFYKNELYIKLVEK